ncbi:glycoside hydrolase family 66 protein [Nocardioides sp. BP30]|uniref:glycoside hydrolase family 66 protein n=1 Tax=Nocardioides sp. BP30 TaxID=3036374 RepID=UPI0024696C87|nr:glycoside hydrolase family 66 protein [Nocardioides sp. BP30]WGL52175.1 glycoside hydrolase family 66 protein [Nocardioides sp. BP30]
MTPEILPTRAVYGPGQSVAIEVRALSAPARLVVRRLGEMVITRPVEHAGIVELGELPFGGYSVELGDLRTAVEVTADPRSVLRYGFVVDYRPRRDLSAVRDNLRRLHLTGVQFYDWAYRHADLLGGGEQYDDALGQPVSLATVRDLVDACHDVGAEALGYAAVYAVGPQEWAKWEHDALLTGGGTPYGLGDFLFLVDPAAPDWLEHFRADLADAVTSVGFDGFHLDQYGYPKRAHRPDDGLVDVAESFCRMIEGVREQLPHSRLVFNNVNDFPTWASAHTPQDAVYIEVWKPQLELGHLAQVVTRARAEAEGKPVVIAAYQHVYDKAEAAEADRAAALTMATLYSHGATHLLAGEADRVLVDPYYVRNHIVEEPTADLLRRYYDFAVAHGELLFPASVTDVTASFAGDYNDDIDVHYGDADVTQVAAAGTVWRRITQDGSGRYVLHLINLVGQDDTAWDEPRAAPGDPGPATLRMRRMGPDLPRIRWADPDRQHHLVDVDLSVDGDYLSATLPAPHLWQLVFIDPFPHTSRGA